MREHTLEIELNMSWSICKELSTGNRKLIPSTNLVVIDWRKMTYASAKEGHEFKRRTDYGRVKKGPGDDEPHLYKYWVITTVGGLI